MDTKSLTWPLDPKYFPLPLDVRWLGGKMWQLLAPFEYHSEKHGIIRAETNFMTDFGSKPWWTWPLVGSPTDNGGAAYIIHDWLCVKATWDISITDKLFLEALKNSDVPYIKRVVMYSGVALWHIFN